MGWESQLWEVGYCGDVTCLQVLHDGWHSIITLAEKHPGVQADSFGRIHVGQCLWNQDVRCSNPVQQKEQGIAWLSPAVKCVSPALAPFVDCWSDGDWTLMKSGGAQVCRHSQRRNILNQNWQPSVHFFTAIVIKSIVQRDFSKDSAKTIPA